jgi:phosphatidylinositol alpha 1,6-mannosyltransferase
LDSVITEGWHPVALGGKRNQTTRPPLFAAQRESVNPGTTELFDSSCDGHAEGPRQTPGAATLSVVDGKGPAARLRVLIAAESFLPAVNGVTMSVVRAADHLQRNGHAVTLIAPRYPSHTAGAAPPSVELGRLELPSVIEPVRSVPLPFYRSLRVARPSLNQARQLLRAHDPDVVHLAAPTVMGSVVAKAAAEYDIPVVALFQTDLAGFAAHYPALGWTGPAIWSWLRRVHARADLTLAPTPTVADQLRSRGFESVAVWGRGVDHHQFDPKRRSDEFRRRCDPDGRPLVGYVGRLAAEKRIERLAVLAHRQDFKLVIVGDGPAKPALERALPDAHFAGFLSGDELGQAVASLDVFVHTGEHETYCQAVQEAMSAGVPVVAPAAGGPLDLISDGTTGLLYGPGDDQMLAVAVGELLDDPDRRTAMAARAKASVEGRSWASLGDQLVSHYRSVIGSSPPNGQPARQVVAVAETERQAL